MNQKNSVKLFKRFTFFHPEKRLTESLMAFGFECGDGWFNIIWNLCEKIEEELKNHSRLDDFVVLQVKEKFGMLRFYTNFEIGKMRKYIEEAEKESANTCEICGKKGKLRDDLGWIVTLCDKHYSEKLNKC